MTNAIPTIFEDVGHIDITNGGNITTQIPGDVKIGQALVLTFHYAGAGGSITFTDPAGWTVVGNFTKSTVLTTKVYTKIVGSGDAGSNVTVGTPVGGAKGILILRILDGCLTTGTAGTGGGNLVLACIANVETVSGTVHTMPIQAITSGDSGSVGIEIIADRSSPGSTSFTWPSGTHYTSTNSDFTQTLGGAISTTVNFNGTPYTTGGSINAGGEQVTGTVNTPNAISVLLILRPGLVTSTVGISRTVVANTATHVSNTKSLKYNTLANTPIIKYVNSRITSGGSIVGSNMPVLLPTTVTANNYLLIFLDVSGNGVVTTPTGWTLVAGPNQITTVLQSNIYAKLAAPGDSGSTVNFAYVGGSTHWLATARQHSGVDSASGVVISGFQQDTVSGTNHLLPTVTVPTDAPIADDCWIIAHSCERQGTETGFTVPGGPWSATNSDGGFEQSGGGGLASITFDSNNVVTHGAQGGQTVNGNIAQANTITSIVAIRTATAAVALVGISKTPLYNILRHLDLVPGTILYNLKNFLTVIKCVIDEAVNITDSPNKNKITQTINEATNVTDAVVGTPSNNLPLKVGINRTILYQYRDLATVQQGDIDWNVLVNGVGITRTLVYNDLVKPTIILTGWQEYDELPTTWTETDPA